MGTTTISGTTATGAGAATLTTLRDRVLQQVGSAGSGIDQTPVAVSALTLTTARDRLEVVLQDSGNAIWATGDLDEALRQALEQYSRFRPAHAIGTITLAAAGREISISSLTGLLRVEKVWWDYDSTAPGHPPQWRRFETWPGSIIYVNDQSQPASGDVVRVWYTKAHTLNGLDAAAATTLPLDDQAFLIAGAAAFAARFRAVELAEKATVDGAVQSRLLDWASVMMAEFNEGLKIRDWSAYNYNPDQNDLDEALRWAIARYSEIHPEQVIAALTLAAAGREVSISSITSYVQMLRVWWPYTSADPEYPPLWRQFELWPGDVLFIDDPDEPAIGDVVRLWYTRDRALSGLDGAAATTIPDEDVTLIVTGASGYAAQMIVQEEEQRYVPRKLREWADARIAEFNRGLDRLARRNAARASGHAGLPALDRWDDGSGWS